LLAPTMPFMAEELYQNLVRAIDPSAPESVHLADWPAYDAGLIDEQLNHDMTLVMQLASLGHAARNKANRKVRQPLAQAKFAVGSADEQQVIGRYEDLLKDELNVKSVGTLMEAGEAVDYVLNPLPKQLGQKYGARFPAVRQAVILLDASQAAPKLLEGKPVEVVVEGERLEILPEEVEVRVQAHAGYAVAAEGAYLAALVTDLTPELIQEGLAREFVRRVQDLRKQAELDISDRIAIYYQASFKLAAAIKSFQDYICTETLAVELLDEKPREGCNCVEDEFDGEKVSIGLEKRLL
jgi:isoleucyl-tRNA synthetase